jgi:hypothetical protein
LPNSTHRGQGGNYIKTKEEEEEKKPDAYVMRREVL